MNNYDVAELAQTLFEEAGDALFLFDPDSEQVLDVNPMGQRLTGESRRQLQAYPITHLFHAEQPGGLKRLRSAFHKTGLFHAQDGFFLRQPGAGRWLPVNLTINRLHTDTGTLGLITARDMSEQCEARLLLKKKQEALEHSRQALLEQFTKLQTFFNHTPVGLAWIDRDLRFVQVNERLARDHGLSPEEHVGRGVLDIPNSQFAAFESSFRLVLETGRALENLEASLPADGEPAAPCAFLYSFYPHRLMDGGVGGIFVVVVDITRRVQAERSLRAGEERYRLLFERNLAGVFRSSATGELLDCNDSMARILGYDSRAQILESSSLDFYLNPEERETLLWNLRENGYLTNYQIQFRRRDGTPIWVLENVSMLHDALGREILEGTIVDISEQKRQENALRVSEAKYRSLIENLDQCIFLKDQELRFVAANGNFCQGLGLTENDLLGKTDLDLYPRELAEKYRADDLKVLAGERIQLEEENVQHDRRLRVRVHKTPVKDSEGRTVGVLGIFWDVTQQVALEAQVRQMQKMDAIGQLAGGVAHDFNNLLTVILGNVSYVLGKHPSVETSHELLRNAEQAALRAADLTRRLLNFSRRTPLRSEPVDFNQAIDETLRFLRRTIDPRIELVVHTLPDLWHVQADPNQLNQVLMNLAVNARDAMPDGGRLTFETAHFTPDESYLRGHLEARPGDYVRLRVRDTGCGMPPEIHARIFEPFFTTKPPGKGTGLGLANVFGIIRQHQGWIDCDSRPGEGTSFDLFLPRCEVEAAASAMPGRPPSNGSGTILLVDDEPMIRSLGEMVLRRFGYHVLLAEDGQQGVDVYREKHAAIDLVILDGAMPRLSGRDALKEMIGINAKVRVLFSSGFAAEHLDLRDFEQVVDFIHKPYRVEELAAKVRETVGRGRK